MKDQNKKGGITILGGSTIEIGKYTYSLMVILSDHKDPKEQEMAIFQFKELSAAYDMRVEILKYGVKVKTEEDGVKVELHYPAHQIRKTILRSEPITMKTRGRDDN